MCVARRMHDAPCMKRREIRPRRRRRCLECRHWFLTHVSAAGHQRTCGEDCRRGRRRRLARARRGRDVREYRVDERERQRACRERRKEGSGGAMSRPGLGAEIPALQRELLEIVDKHVEVSRAGLRREVRRLLRVRSREVGPASVSGA